jgi:hypothetical protein
MAEEVFPLGDDKYVHYGQTRDGTVIAVSHTVVDPAEADPVPSVALRAVSRDTGAIAVQSADISELNTNDGVVGTVTVVGDVL